MACGVARNINKKIFLEFVIILLSFLICKDVSAWDKRTHSLISQYAAENSVLSKDRGDYLKNLGFDNGLNEYFEWGKVKKQVFNWIKEGSELEDDSNLFINIVGNSRSNNHFHNPLKSWDRAGLDDWVIFHYTGMFSILWAQDGSYQDGFNEGDWSWQKIRDYYYLALTSQSREESDAYFAKTFRGLGHQMHLIQDASVPEHARNDAHPMTTFGVGIEAWVGKKIKSLKELKAFIQEEIKFPSLSLDVPVSFNGRALVPVAQLTDADYYNGSNPSESLAQGLSEYANANFFSEDTVFSAENYRPGHRHYFPYPRRSSTDIDDYENEIKVPEVLIAEDGGMDITFYLMKAGDGERGYRLVRGSYFTRETGVIKGKGYLYYSSFYLDDLCYEDYARLILPGAVGYSVALIDYFFRGKISAEGAILQRDKLGDITGIKTRIKNMTPGESILFGSNGSKFLLVCEYVSNHGIIRKTSNEIFLKEEISSDGISESEYVFTFDEPISFSSQARYFLVYRGRLGNEDDSVIGVMFSVRPCFNAGVLYIFYLKEKRDACPSACVLEEFAGCIFWSGWAGLDIYTATNTDGYSGEEGAYNFICIFYPDPAKPCYSWNISEDSRVMVKYIVEHDYLRRETHEGVDVECYDGVKRHYTAADRYWIQRVVKEEYPELDVHHNLTIDEACGMWDRLTRGVGGSCPLAGMKEGEFVLAEGRIDKKGGAQCRTTRGHRAKAFGRCENDYYFYGNTTYHSENEGDIRYAIVLTDVKVYTRKEGGWAYTGIWSGNEQGKSFLISIGTRHTFSTLSIKKNRIKKTFNNIN